MSLARMNIKRIVKYKMGPQQFCLKWNHHSSNMLTIFEQLLTSESLVDVTLACDGLSLKAHKMVLSACSPYFHELFLENPCKHPIVILKDVKYNDLKAVIDFMYRGEVNVSQNELSALLQTAEMLKIKGLAEVSNEQTRDSSNVIQQEIIQEHDVSLNVSEVQRLESPILRKRKRCRPRRGSMSDSNRNDSEEPLASKLKAVESLECLESSSKDVSNASTDTQPVMKGEDYSPSQVSIHSVSMYPTNVEQKLGSLGAFACQTMGTSGEDDQSDGETEFETEPSKLMEQTLTTDNVAAYSDGQSQDSCLPVISAQSSLSSSTACVESPLQNCDPSGNGQILVSCSSPSETFTSMHSSKDDSQERGPEKDWSSDACIY